MNDIYLLLTIAFTIFFIWGLYKLTHMDGIIGTCFRWSWNIVIFGFSLIPGFGWLNRFVVTKDEELKEKLVEEGEAADRATQERWSREKAEREAEMEARSKQPEVYRETYHDGWVDREKMKVSSDGERYYDPKDGEWHQI